MFVGLRYGEKKISQGDIWLLLRSFLIVLLAIYKGSRDQHFSKFYAILVEIESYEMFSTFQGVGITLKSRFWPIVISDRI